MEVSKPMLWDSEHPTAELMAETVMGAMKASAACRGSNHGQGAWPPVGRRGGEGNMYSCCGLKAYHLEGNYLARGA